MGNKMACFLLVALVVCGCIIPALGSSNFEEENTQRACWHTYITETYYRREKFSPYNGTYHSLQLVTDTFCSKCNFVNKSNVEYAREEHVFENATCVYCGEDSRGRRAF